MSLHTYGTAIGINPVQNPCIYSDTATGIAICTPVAGIK